MTADEIRYNIWYNEDLIDQRIAEKVDLEKQIEELDLLKSKFSRVQTDFGDRQQQRKNNLASFLSNSVQNKIPGRYYDGMNGLLTGADFNKAYHGLSEAKDIISSKISQLDQRLDDCRDNLAYRRRQRDYWQSRLNIALAEEAT